MARESFPVTVERSRVANGGWEYHLVVDGERVETTGTRGLGIFTRADATPAQALARLLLGAHRRMLR